MERASFEKFESEEEPSLEKLRVAAESAPSEKHPERNEDAYLVDEEHRAFGVFDGMGGHVAGEVASSLARDSVARRLAEIPDKAAVEEMTEAVKQALVAAHNEIKEKAEADPEKYEGMGTTATVLKIWEGKGERKAIIGHVGDSRFYRLPARGNLEEVTLDDSLFVETLGGEKEARRSQEKLSKITDPDELDGVERVYWNNRYAISQALGVESIQPHLEVIDINSGDKFLITSDGIHDNLTDDEIERILKEASLPEAAVRALVEAAGEKSRKGNSRSKADDMTAIEVEF